MLVGREEFWYWRIFKTCFLLFLFYWFWKGFLCTMQAKVEATLKTTLWAEYLKLCLPHTVLIAKMPKVPGEFRARRIKLVVHVFAECQLHCGRERPDPALGEWSWNSGHIEGVRWSEDEDGAGVSSLYSDVSHAGGIASRRISGVESTLGTVWQCIS